MFKKIFFSLIAPIFLLILLSPRLIERGYFSMQDDHDMLAILIAILFLISFAGYRFYKREAEKRHIEI